MTNKITLELTLDELKTLDKNLYYCEETWSICDKIKYAYPQLKMTPQQEGEYAVVSYNDTTYYRFINETTFSWYKRIVVIPSFPTPSLVMVDDAETERLLEGLYYNHIEVKKEKEPEDNEWKNVALEFGKKLPVILPYSYNEFTPNAWYKWAIFVFDGYVKQRDIECGYTPNQKEQKWDAVRESAKWCEDHPNKNPLDYLTPKTPEETEESLKEAFREAQQTEKWKRIQQKIDDGYFNDFIFIDRPNLLDFLKDKLGYSLDSCYEIVDAISEWLPETQNASGSQNAYVESAVEGWNDAINAIRGKLQ